MHQYSDSDFAPRMAPGAGLRRKPGRVIEASYEVTDDHYRTVHDDVFRDRAFRPTQIEVHIDVDCADYYVALSGRFYDAPYGTVSAPGRAVFPGKDFLDVHEHRNTLVTDAVIACLRDHGLMKEG